MVFYIHEKNKKRKHMKCNKITLHLRRRISMENNKNMTQATNRKKETMMFCGVITCINCVNETCTSDTCDLYEDSQSQEG